MPRYEVDLTNTTAGNLVLPKGDYEFVIGDARAFGYTRDDGSEVYGISYPLTVAEGQYKGQSLGRQRFYLHTPGAARMTKAFLMAAAGFKTDQTSEAEFNNTYGSDWSVDPETEECGENFQKLSGRRVKASCDVQPNNFRPGEMQQTFRWMPF